MPKQKEIPKLSHDEFKRRVERINKELQSSEKWMDEEIKYPSDVHHQNFHLALGKRSALVMALRILTRKPRSSSKQRSK